MSKEILTQDVDLGLAKILVLANLINRKTELCCFISDSGRVRSLSIRMYPNIKQYNGAPISFDVSYDTSEKYKFDIDTNERLSEINRCIEFLENCLKERKIDYSFLDPIKKYVVTSYAI